MKILVLGHRGMLGHMLVKYFIDKGHSVETTEFKFLTPEFTLKVLDFDGDFIVNAIGAIPQKTSEFTVNSELPIWLATNSKVPVIHPGTDCEMDADAYGISKKLARDYIVNNSINTKIIRTSIIGPELYTKKSLMEWFLNTDQESCQGYTQAMWNGITTYEWAKQCEALMLNWPSYAKETIVSGNCVSKFKLLHTIAKIFNKQIVIEPVEKGINKCLVPNIQTLSIEDQLIELKKYYYDN
jgi:dTDP-4-dehydrorhamnose reductase